MEKIIIELTPLMARVFQRLLATEIESQQQWMTEEEQEFGTTDHKTREHIIDECESLRNNLEEKGYEKYYKYY